MPLKMYYKYECNDCNQVWKGYDAPDDKLICPKPTCESKSVSTEELGKKRIPDPSKPAPLRRSPVRKNPNTKADPPIQKRKRSPNKKKIKYVIIGGHDEIDFIHTDKELSEADVDANSRIFAVSHELKRNVKVTFSKV
jgi:hypothetical protein